MTETKEQNNLAPALVVVWAAVLLIAFASYRGADLGKLGGLIGGVFTGPLVGAGFGDTSLGVVAAALVVLSWFGLGSLVNSLIARFFGADEDAGAIKLARDFASGAIVWSIVWFLLGAAGLYSKAAAIASIVVGIGLAVRYLVGRPKSQPNEKFDLSGKIAFGLTAFISLLALIAAIAPPTAKDTLLYHFSVPKNFIASGGSAVIEGNIASYLALGTEMHVVWAMLTGGLFSVRAGEVAAGVTVFAFLPILLLAIFGWARDAGLSKSWSMIAALLFASIPTAYHVAAGGYIDLALALFLTLALHAFTRWWTELSSRRLAIAAIFLGGALAVKLTAAFGVLALLVVVLLRAREAQSNEGENAGKIFADGVIAFLAAGIIGSLWYVRDWIATGSPVFPFYMNVWKGTAPGWDVERSLLFQIINSRYGGASKGVFDYLLAPVNISIKAQPELPDFFDGVVGVAFLFGIPLVVWAWRKSVLRTEFKLGVLFAALLLFFWLFTSQQIRYLLPVFPVLAVAICFAADALAAEIKPLKNAVAYSLLLIALAGAGVSLAWFAKKSPLAVALGGETRDAYLTDNVDYYPYYQLVNRDLPADAKVWLINMRRDSYLIERPYFSDYMFEDWTLRKLAGESKTSAELRAKAKALGFTHVLARHDVLLDYAKTVIYDEKRSETENRARLAMVREFLLDGALRSDARFTLVKLP